MEWTIIGLNFLYAMSSTMIHGVGRDARHVVDAIARRSEVSPGRKVALGTSLL